MFAGAQFQVRNAAGNVLATVTVPNTGGFQTWQTVSASVALSAGQQTIRVYTSNAYGGWNLNWLEVGSSPVATLSSLRTTTIAAAEEAASIQVYPNPIQDRFSVTVDNALTGVLRIDLVNMSTGSVAKSYQLQKTAEGPAQFYLSASEIQSGNYLLRATMTGWTQATQIIKN
jgi:endoglucanase